MQKLIALCKKPANGRLSCDIEAKVSTDWIGWLATASFIILRVGQTKNVGS
jgi:hypothetical protein